MINSKPTNLDNQVPLFGFISMKKYPHQLSCGTFKCELGRVEYRLLYSADLEYYSTLLNTTLSNSE